jgi:hypothetical protein
MASADEAPTRSISQPGVPGAFGVMRQPTAQSVLQDALKSEVRARNEELLRVQREDEQRANLVVSLEQEVFEKERRLVELTAGMQNLGILESNVAGGVAPTPENLAAKERERLQNEIEVREAEAVNLRQRTAALEELIREKRAEVVAKGEATLQLLFQLSSTSVAANPTPQVSRAAAGFTDAEK